MLFNDGQRNLELRHKGVERVVALPFGHGVRHREDGDAETGIAAIAHEENWLTPLPEVARITLAPWQQAVFWGLRIYIVVMLGVMGLAFFRSLG